MTMLEFWWIKKWREKKPSATHHKLSLREEAPTFYHISSSFVTLTIKGKPKLQQQGLFLPLSRGQPTSYSVGIIGSDINSLLGFPTTNNDGDNRAPNESYFHPHVPSPRGRPGGEGGHVVSIGVSIVD